MSEEMDSAEEYVEMAPLDLDIVLEKVLKYLGTKEVAKCRMVNQQWESLATQIMLKRRDLSVTLDCNSVQEFVDLMEKSERFPFSCLKIMCLPLHEKVLTKLWDVSGDSLKVIVLDMKIIESHADCIERDDCSPCFSFLELLRKLGQTLEVIDFDEMSPTLSFFPYFEIIDILPFKVEAAIGHMKKNCEEWSAESIQRIVFPAQDIIFSAKFWELVFNQTTNLSQVYLNHKIQSCLLEALKDSNRLDQLKKLRLEYISEPEVEMLLASNIKLEEFKINTISNTVSGKQIEKLLKKFHLTLKVLALGSPENDKKIIISIPMMPELTKLGLFHCDDSLILPENFGANLPKLRDLAVSSPYKNLDWKEYFSFGSHSDIKNLNVKVLSIALEVANCECCSYLGQRFPNVQNLSLEFPKNDFLSRMWITWENLTELYIYFDGYSNTTLSRDVSLCGVSERWKERKKYDLTPVGEFAETDGGLFPSLGFIGVHNLKHLQKLVIEEGPVNNKKKYKNLFLSDLSVYWSLATLKDLRVLKIGRSRISNHAKKYLYKKLPMISSMDIRGEDGPGIFSEEEKAELLSYIDSYNSVG